MNEATKALVRARAGNRCEYCHLSQADSPLALLHIEHIVPKKHRGTDDQDILALACVDCNLYKGTNLVGIDPVSNQIAELFNPRRNRWDVHFTWQSVHVVGQTAIGRATIVVLDMNSDDQLVLRAS